MHMLYRRDDYTCLQTFHLSVTRTCNPFYLVSVHMKIITMFIHFPTSSPGAERVELALLYYVFLLLILVAKGLYFQKLLDDMLSPLCKFEKFKTASKMASITYSYKRP